MANEKQSLAKKVENTLEYFIFASRWVQAPIYVALIFAAIAYAWKSVQELLHLLDGFSAATESTIMVGILSLVDISMVANLVNMVVGGYVTFVSRIDFGDNGDRPDWLDHINANTLKVKLAGSLASISAIHLLKSFIAITDFVGSGAAMSANHEKVILWQAIIHGVFLASMILFAWGEKMQRTEGH